MRHFISLGLLALLASPVSFAAHETNSPDCDTIAKACIDAGFTERDGQDKAFWHDCMKPILLGKEVSGVTLDANVAKACRKAKIKSLQDEAAELKKVK